MATTEVLKALGNKCDISCGKLHNTQIDVTRLRAIRSYNILKRAKGDPVNKTTLEKSPPGLVPSSRNLREYFPSLFSSNLYSFPPTYYIS